MYGDKITIESAKGANQLYFRDLSDSQIDYVRQLQVRFQEQRGTKAAERALFGFLDLEKKHQEQTEAGNKLSRDYQDLLTEYEAFRKRIAGYFKLMEDVSFTKDNIVNDLNKPLVKSEIGGSFRNNKFGQTSNLLNRQTNGLNG
ncbi:MAG: hypothetical protein V4456_11290 [Bacteroidota bacterium]